LVHELLRADSITLAWEPLLIPVDACVTQGEQCGQPAALVFCQAQGFNSTGTIGENSACRYTLTASGFECDAKTVAGGVCGCFSSIECCR
jgi:hypothetical protein